MPATEASAFGVAFLTAYESLVITDDIRRHQGKTITSPVPVYIAQRGKLLDGLKQAVKWYEEGKLKPMVTQILPFGARQLQEAFEAFLRGSNTVGKIVVQCGPSSGGRGSKLLGRESPTSSRRKAP
ncbi:MAG TPA: zinc-binding dehydrogenase [Rectinemataceae bacterium]|nr:zinc-binding dehydrogenase [Rectinemataceae bacterium]